MPLVRKPIGVDQAAQRILQFTQIAKAQWNWLLLFPQSIFLFKQILFLWPIHLCVISFCTAAPFEKI
jgi:hypothetical protein